MMNKKLRRFTYRKYILTMFIVISIVGCSSKITKEVFIPYSRAYFEWSYPTSVSINYFTLKCGFAHTGPYVIQQRISPTDRTTLVQPLVVIENQKHYCVITASNDDDESNFSNEILFELVSHNNALHIKTIR